MRGVRKLRDLSVAALLLGVTVGTGVLGGHSVASAAPAAACAPTLVDLGSGSWALPPDLQSIVDASSPLDVRPPPAGSPTFDMDDDGTADTVTIDADHTVTITRGDGALVIPTNGVTGVVGADVDGDGHDEASLTYSPTPPNLALTYLVPGTTPTGTLTSPPQVMGTLTPDRSGDGLPDLVIFETEDSWFTQRADQALATAIGPRIPIDSVLSEADLDQDGTPDRVTATNIGEDVHVRLSTGADLPLPSITGADYSWVKSYRGSDGTAYLVSFELPFDVNPPMTLWRIDTTCDGAFVRAAYHDLLGRAPTLDEARETVIGLQSPHGTRLQLAYGLALRPEWVSVIVTDLYHRTLAREPDAGGLHYWVDQLLGDPPARTVVQVTSSFYASPEYFDAHGGTTEGWMTALYQALLHRDPDPGGLAYWTAEARDHGRRRAASRLLQSPESARSRVAALYQALLGRQADPSGLDHWSGLVVTNGDLAVAANLIASPEYYQAAQTRFP